MRSLTSMDSRDIPTGLRMAEIGRVSCGDEESLRDRFHRTLADGRMGLIVLATEGFYTLEKGVIGIKMYSISPLIVTIPEIDGQMDQGSILEYIQESIGIGMEDDVEK